MPNDDTKQPKNNNDQPLTVNTVQPVKDIVNPSPIGLSGSAAPADDVLMPLTVAASQPRKKFAGGKIIATILGLFLLVGGVGAGVYLTGQNQNPQEKADDILYRYEKICTKAGSPRAWCVDETRTECPNDPGSPRSCTDSFWNSWSCSGDEREPCGGQGGGGGGGTPSCPAGTTYVCGTPAQTFCPTFNTCDFPNKNTGIWCDQTGSENNGNLKDWYLCQTNCSCQPPATPTPPAITAQCQNIKAYNATWIELTTAQLSALKAGHKVNFCVTGVATGGSFDKARFTINNVLQAETSTVRPSSTDFCQLYSIPTATTIFNITAQIHHTTLGWK